MKLLLIIGILFFPGLLFSQSIQPSFLVGKWEFQTISLDFKNDSMVMVDLGDEAKMCSFLIDTIPNDLIISMTSKNDSSLRAMIWKIRKINYSEINLEVFKIKEFNNSTNDWEEQEISRKLSFIFRRILN